MTSFKADLHCHSTCSDGTVTPEGLVKLAMQIGLQGLSITDHDTIQAYDQAMPLAEALGLRMISGVEFSTVLNGVSVHVLGYSFDLRSKAIQSLCQKHQLRREHRNLAILDNLKAHKMPLTMDDVLACMDEHHGTIGRPHIAMAMVRKGYVPSLEDAFKRYLGEGKSCYSSGKQFGIEETLEVIHEAGGLAVIAHPHLLQNESILKKLLEMPFDGIECFYARFQADQNQRWLDIAEKKKWLVTGGSDFHGAVKALIPLGNSWVEHDRFKPLEKHFQHHLAR